MARTKPSKFHASMLLVWPGMWLLVLGELGSRISPEWLPWLAPFGLTHALGWVMVAVGFLWRLVSFRWMKVVVPAAFSGILASFLLAISRAVGETMAVTLAAGATPKLTLNPLESIQTMTAYIVQVSQGDTPAGTVEYRTIFAVGLTLFFTTMLMNVLAQWVLRRTREKYE